MIDRELNYGRHLIQKFLHGAMPFNRVVDIGAGQGKDLSLARAVNPAGELHAVECWPPNVAILNELGVKSYTLNIERDSLPFGDGEVDVVIANQVLEHTKDLFWIFHEVTRLLPIGGSFIIGVPNLASFHNRALLAIGRQPTVIKSASAHVRGFTLPDILDFLDKCFPGGYKLAENAGSNFYPFPGAVAKILARIFPLLAWGFFVRIVKSSNYSGEFLKYPSKERLETNFYVGPESGNPPRS